MSCKSIIACNCATVSVIRFQELRELSDFTRNCVNRKCCVSHVILHTNVWVKHLEIIFYVVIFSAPVKMFNTLHFTSNNFSNISKIAWGVWFHMQLCGQEVAWGPKNPQKVVWNCLTMVLIQKILNKTIKAWENNFLKLVSKFLHFTSKKVPKYRSQAPSKLT